MSGHCFECLVRVLGTFNVFIVVHGFILDLANGVGERLTLEGKKHVFRYCRQQHFDIFFEGANIDF